MSDTVLFIFKQNGEKNYIGEDVTQIQHMAQAARFAESETPESDVKKAVVIGAFLHDIGHLIDQDVLEKLHMDIKDLGLNTIERMITNNTDYGTKDHEIIGANFCKHIGLPDLTCNLIRNHAKTKRYLITTNPEYRSKVSAASLKTLEHQGGLMSEEEVVAYSNDVMLDMHIKMRLWDERAKDVNNLVPDVDIYRYFSMIDDVIKK